MKTLNQLSSHGRIGIRLLLLSLGLALMPPIMGAEPAATPIATEQPKQGTTHRGFNMGGRTTEFPQLLQEAVTKWNVNIVRYVFRHELDSKYHGAGTPEEAWEKQLALLPANLDAAKKLGVTMVILAGCPNTEAQSKYPQDRKEWLHAYWNDESNLQALITGWKRIAEVCKNRDQEFWYDIFNEPLDWKDYPNYPKNWPRWAQAIVDEIRKIDPNHPILVPTGPGGLCLGFKDFPVLNGKNIIYEVHMYVPHEYTHQGLADIRATDLRKAYLERQKSYPGSFSDGALSGYWDRQMLELSLKPVIDFQKKHPEIPIFVGEFSVARWAPGGEEYLKDCIEIFEKYGWDWAYHGFHEDPIWSLEHTEEYSIPQEARIAPEMTARGKVVKSYLDRNRR